MTFLARACAAAAPCHHVGTGLHDLLDFEADLAEVDVEVLQDAGGDPPSLPDETQQDVLGADVFMIEALSPWFGQLHDLPGSVCESFVHGLPVGERGMTRIAGTVIVGRFSVPCCLPAFAARNC